MDKNYVEQLKADMYDISNQLRPTPPKSPAMIEAEELSKGMKKAVADSGIREDLGKEVDALVITIMLSTIMPPMLRAPMVVAAMSRCCEAIADAMNPTSAA